jgi:iron complex transport system substrate-binding protein
MDPVSAPQRCALQCARDDVLRQAFAKSSPSRIVSINLCTDILLLELADRQQIASLSFLAADPSLSTIAEKIAGIPINYGRAEEVRLLDPDLVLAGTYGARFAVQILKEHGAHVVEVPPAIHLAEIAPTIETVAAAIGQRARGERMAADVRRRLAELSAARPSARPSAVVFQPRGYAAGRPSLADDALVLAGATNRAADTGFGDWVPLGVEGLLNLDPDFVVLDETEGQPPALAEGVLAHGALRIFSASGRLVRTPSKLWSCGTPATLDAVISLRRAFAQAGGAHGR